ncbi:hypothetical protein C0V70_06500 [Bacteriovorax stolpii]|uniref:Uncharacterized protein n=1 Tax=Bacteriovorax stolpii TaxID=960 RepID=A0A2K9NQI3_BACTC|nr:hypothetical protein [Bacteriovorax stolpii]AUN97767.1 hypothetical protein C0V70_06500 [Bacteriovorax stolpii]TDP51587.1 hypothetical protein C8D79_3031 [Bacteriovorax stolpii]
MIIRTALSKSFGNCSISPRDRRNKYFLYKDQDAFDAAISVGKEREFVVAKVEKFCDENKFPEVFKKFMEELKRS